MLPDDAPITARAGEFSEPTKSDLAAIQPVNILYIASDRRAVFPVAAYPVPDPPRHSCRSPLLPEGPVMFAFLQLSPLVATHELW